MVKINWKAKAIENIFSKKMWAFFCVAFIIVINSLLSIGIDSDSIESLVWLSIGLFAGDGLSKIGDSISKKKKETK